VYWLTKTLAGKNLLTRLLAHKTILPGKGDGANCPASALAENERSLDAVGDGGELSADGCAKNLHRGCGGKGDQSSNQGVLNQILAFFTVHQILELHIHFEKHGVHRFSPRR
jgi:hypothetical protein